MSHQKFVKALRLSCNARLIASRFKRGRVMIRRLLNRLFGRQEMPSVDFWVAREARREGDPDGHSTRSR